MIIHFHNGTGGGVLSVIRNLLEYSASKERDNHIVFVINKDQQPYYEIPEIKGAASLKVFYYSPKWNFYYTCKQLARLIPTKKCILVAHDWLELGMATQLGLPNPVIQFVHGDYAYYYKLALTHASTVNAFVCVSSAISEKLKKQLPARFSDIEYLSLPVPDLQPATNAKPGNRIVFIGRCEKGKGYDLLPLIDDELHKADHQFEWHIYGEGSLDKKKQLIWSAQSNVSFYGNIPGVELMNVLPNYDFLVLPTFAEGMPVTVIEAMMAGVVPVVNHLPGGLEELIGKNERGILIEQNKVEEYAAVLAQLRQEATRVHELSLAASAFARKKFNAVNCTAVIEQFISVHAQIEKKLKARKVYGSRLDQKWLPNTLVNLLRKYFSNNKKKDPSL